MVIGDATKNDETVSPPQQFAPQKATIENIMSGIENTGTVKMNNHRKKLRQRFDIIKKLGQGTYGKVQLGINKESGQEVAIKTIKKSKIETEADLIRIRREVQIMSSVQHPNIIHIYEVFENREKMVLVMEFAAGGELYDYLSERKVLSEEEARRIFRQVATAIYYCHKHKICHRDLKLENILLDENGNAKIADFGLSNVFDEQRLLATFCGSPLYASPEIVKGTPYLGPEVDCWSLGVLLYTLVYGAMPFDGANFKRLVKQISQGDYFEPKKPSRASPLIREMLTVCPQRRANIEQICNHWWVNEGYDECCLDLAEELANQTPVRLDVLLSLAPPSVTADQVVVGSAKEESKTNERIQRSHSVGSIIDMAGTEAERRILDMVAAGGEAALMPSPTRTITPSEISPAQPKRKLEPTVSTENAPGTVKKKEKANDRLKLGKSQPVIPEAMDVESLPPSHPSSVSDIASTMTATEAVEEPYSIENPPVAAKDVLEDLQSLENMCDELLQETTIPSTKDKTADESVATIDAQALPATSTPKIESPTKTVSNVKARLEKLEKADKPTEKVPYKKFYNKNKTVDLTAAVNQVSKQDQEFSQIKSASNLERKNSLPEESLTKPAERRRSRILETAERFQNMNNQNNDKFKKFSLPGVPTVGNYKKEFERKASMQNSISSVAPNRLSSFEMQKKQELDFSSPTHSRQSSSTDLQSSLSANDDTFITKADQYEVKESDSKSSVNSFSLEEARRSMENSIALLNKVRTDASSVNELCSKTENVSVSDDTERERKLKNAREIIGNAIPIGRLRKPPMPFGANGRSATGGIVLSNSASNKQFRYGPETPEPKLDTMSIPRKVSAGNLPAPATDETKTSHAEITLKSATLPRRKIGKPETHSEIQKDLQPSASQLPSMRFSTEMQHQIPDLRSAPLREQPIAFTIQQRSNSLEPQVKEQSISIQKPPTYQRTPSAFGSTRGSLSRQSTNESNDSDTTLSQSQTLTSGTSSGGVMPIKKSPREFIIPIAVEGGGFVTPRANSLEPSESSSASSAGFNTKSRLGRPRKINAILGDKEVEDDSSFPRINRHTSLSRESDSEEPRFHTMHRLRSSRPSQRSTVEVNDSASSGEEDDDDGFEILTAENLFSTLLSRVRALTNRLNVNEPNSTGFPSSRFISNLRQSQAPFWHHHEPFASRLNGGNATSWRRSMSRDLSSDIDSMFSRSGATLPRGVECNTQNSNINNFGLKHNKNVNNSLNNNNQLSVTSTNRNGSNIRCDTKQTSIGNGSNSNIINNNFTSSASSIMNPTNENSEEMLDLADLDLSQLRLSKKDLQALSSITPALSQRVQEQLLAQLPPQQAKKLSRTLSMQNGNITPNTSISYRRSVSSSAGRTNDYAIDQTHETLQSVTPTNDAFEDVLSVQNRGSGKADRVLRNSVNGKDAFSSTTLLVPNYNEDLGIPSPRFAYVNVNHDRYNSYEKYTPYSSNSMNNERSKSVDVDRRFNGYDYSTSRTSCLNPANEYCRRPPSGYVSPPSASSLSGYSSQKSTRRISRFLRPDFFNPQKEFSEQSTLRKELETQKILREIREKSREKSVDRCSNCDYGNDTTERLSNFIDEYKNLSVDDSVVKPDDRDLSTHASNTRSRRSMSTTREDFDRSSTILTTNSTASVTTDRIDELHNIPTKQVFINESNIESKQSKESNEETTFETIRGVPAMRSNNETCSECNIINHPVDEITKNNNQEVNQITDQITAVKQVKVRKTKIKSKLDAEGKPVTVTVKKVKKVVKPTDAVTVQESENGDKKVCDTTMPTKSESKLARPKSYPSKDPETSISSIESPRSCEKPTEKKEEILDSKNVQSNTIAASKIARPKSFPSSKITPPKEIKFLKNTTSNSTLSAISEKTETAVNNAVKVVETAPIIAADNSITTPVTTKKIRKVIRIVKKPVASKTGNIPKIDSSSGNADEAKETTENRVETVLPTVKEKSKSPEKKLKQGFLATIGQKFEKFRDSSKIMKDKKSNSEINETTADKNLQLDHDCDSSANKDERKSCNVSETPEDVPITGSNRKSRIDKMIKNLRDMSVPRPPVVTESNLIKRAVSVEEMPGTFNKCGVSKVLGFFKKIEKESKSNKVFNTKSSSHINTIDASLTVLEPIATKTTTQIKLGEEVVKERPKSGSFVSKIQKPYIGAKSDTVLTMSEQQSKSNVIQSGGIKNQNLSVKNNCLNCYTGDSIKDIPSRHSLASEAKHLLQDEKARVKFKCQTLTLNLNQLNESLHSISTNNNYSYPPPLLSEILRNNLITTSGGNTINNNTSDTNMLTPSYDSITNYSSGSRSSPFDDCNSSSTFMSPSEENELCSDNWSITSDDPNNVLTVSTSVSRMPRLTYMTSVSPVDNDSESVIERIRRKSFYPRFNDKRLKTVNAVAGAGTIKEHYREQYLSNSEQTYRRSKEYGKSSSASTANAFASADRAKNNYDYYRSPTRTPSTHNRRYTNSSDGYSKSSTSKSDYYHHHHHHYHYHLPRSNSSRKLNVSNNDCSDYLNCNNTSKTFLRNTYHETSSSPYYATYQPRRCSLYTSSNTAANITSSSSSIALDTTNTNKECMTGTAHANSSSTTLSGSEGYSTLNKGLRKQRVYDNRSISVLNSTANRESRFDTAGSSSLFYFLARNTAKI
ncbi:probable serine/threonine-protein kinase DDB_G0282963 isoform X3 [Wyeomyia smithii]|uniref:probable serine/threonine-protein kinase DDB_G0282963 isoform X3 n=1 Tax=Wyeomyia smithii TaxID=174621 RepID=UPI002467B19F|nr:probable serine/threonine-protein kinase DDB_G0282963 isoform X3 [Wyeomyia smithii]